MIFWNYIACIFYLLIFRYVKGVPFFKLRSDTEPLVDQNHGYERLNLELSLAPYSPMGLQRVTEGRSIPESPLNRGKPQDSPGGEREVRIDSETTRIEQTQEVPAMISTTSCQKDIWQNQWPSQIINFGKTHGHTGYHTPSKQVKGNPTSVST